jgi:hypothetical protein
MRSSRRTVVGMGVSRKVVMTRCRGIDNSGGEQAWVRRKCMAPKKTIQFNEKFPLNKEIK